MFDNRVIVGQLTGAGLFVEQADSIMDAIRQDAEHGEEVTSETLDPELPSPKARVTWPFVGAMVAQLPAKAGGVVAMLCLSG